MNKHLRFSIEDAVKYFNDITRSENEEYLLNLILQLGKEYNSLIDKHNKLVYENAFLNRKLASTGIIRHPNPLSTFNKKA